MMEVDIAALMTVLASATVVVAGGYAGVSWLGRKFDRRITEVATSTKATADQVRTSNGKTLAAYTEETARDLASVKSHMTELATRVDENRDRAVRAEAIALHAHERIDRHLGIDHGDCLSPQGKEE